MATCKNFTCLLPWGNEPTMSSPHCANNHRKAIVVSFSDGTRWMFPNLWHLSHLLTNSFLSFCKVGQK